MAANQELDLNDWEFLLPAHGRRQYSPRFLDHHLDGDDGDDGDDGVLVVSTVSPTASSPPAAVPGLTPKVFLDMNYFICPPSIPPPIPPPDVGGGGGDRLIPGVIPTAPFLQEQNGDTNAWNSVEAAAGDDGDALPHQVSFNRISKETEFVDMKLDLESPKFSSPRFVLHQIDAAAAFETAAADADGDDRENRSCSAAEMAAEMAAEVSDVNGEKEAAIGWGKPGKARWLGWGFTGIGALCSFGVAATSICVLIIAAHHHVCTKIQFQNLSRLPQIHAHGDKRIWMVKGETEHAAAAEAGRLKLKDGGVSAAIGGVTLAGARISFLGGDCDGVQS